MTRSYTSSMKIEPVKYSRLIMQLMMPTPIKALRHERRASPSSVRPGTAAIKNDLFENGCRDSLVLPMFRRIVHLRRINLNAGAGGPAGTANPAVGNRIGRNITLFA